ncbi:hypothetical protein SAMN02745130_00772 [Thiothrix eikelboomii]|uniref:Uncharacterized protein n=1 Tax=Thiothrix eikelboomii TaxID=92487 RepID=A0A1T4W1G6_9GAMM|nr:hypothetical protein [Thiothrix eikelboomii]SKA70571.1 hypothetical protein SAMN02745130_00772 [Thiothrix eikelboomii]
MAARKKSRLERWLSFNQHRKRFGATQAAASLQNADYTQLKTQLLTDTEQHYTHGADKDLSQHLLNLRAEFAGQAELLYYHAQLIVLIRREYQTLEQFAQFERLWEAEGDFLRQQLNTRWLISAADTFADHATDPTTRALALAASLLVNTIKLQETERYLQAAEHLSDQADRQQQLQTERVALFDGTSAFAVGTDDTLRNLRWRLDAMSTAQPMGQLLVELFERLQTHDTVYQRFRQRHTRAKTAWW